MSDHTGTDRMAAFLKNHPRMLRWVAGLVVLLSQAGTVLAENGNTATGGP